MVTLDGIRGLWAEARPISAPAASAATIEATHRRNRRLEAATLEDSRTGQLRGHGLVIPDLLPLKHRPVRTGVAADCERERVRHARAEQDRPWWCRRSAALVHDAKPCLPTRH